MEKYKKIDGWLLFFIFSYCSGAYLTLKGSIKIQEVVNISSFLSSSVKIIGTISWLISIVHIVGFIIFILLLRKKDKRCINVFLISQSIYIILTFVLYILIKNISFVDSSALVGIIKDAIVLGIWYVYFQKSERIEVYFS